MIHCASCGCPIQRALGGDLEDGLRLHIELIHPDLHESVYAREAVITASLPEPDVDEDYNPLA